MSDAKEMKEFAIWNAISQVVVETQEYVGEQDVADFDIEQTISKRAEIRNKVQEISEKVRKAHNAKVAKYASFGLVVWLDEIMAGPYEKANHPWPSLQKELFETTEGGIVFYEYLDEVLTNPFYPHFIYQIYYCMLKGDFKGQHVNDNKYVLQNYMTRLEEVLGYTDKEESLENGIVHTPIVVESKAAQIRKKVVVVCNRHYGLCVLTGLVSLYGIFSLALFVK